MEDDLFPAATPADVSLADQIACVEREIAMRVRVYPRFVEANRMSQGNSDRELLVMHAVLATLNRIERLGPGADVLLRPPPDDRDER